jgi:hypothetical protein
MSDTGKTILWIVVAIVVVAVVIWLFASARRSREADARRFEAGELRAQVEDRLPQVQSYSDRASVTEQIASEARAEADKKAAAARRLEEQAAEYRTSAEAARSEQETLARRADLIDPDVRTDAEGYPLDEEGRRPAGEEPSRPAGEEPSRPAGEPLGGGASAPGRAGALGGAAAAGGAVVGARAFGHEDDDEEDLADAENPFASEAAAAEASVSTEPTESASTAAPDEAPVSTQPTEAKEPMEPAALSEETGFAERDEPSEPPAAGEPSAAGGFATAGGSSGEGAEGMLGTSRPESEAPTEEAGAVAAQAEDRRDAAVDDEQASLEANPSEVVSDAVPALADRDEHVAAGGTPPGDPGDHRGQPWATTPGTRGLDEDIQEEEAEQPSGLDADMSPTGHTGEPAGTEGSTSEGGEPSRRPDDDNTAQPAASAARPAPAPASESAVESAPEPAPEPAREPAPEPAEVSVPEEPTAEPGAEPGGRRISTFDEVTDGGYGIGSAAPIADGAQPLGHAVKGTREGTTFMAPADQGYDDVDPDVWFYNEEAARRAGFRREGE